ncbi:glutamate/tyrosine decarboxylase-like PLP-dependent enzyme [Lacibacter cauensis]|uniref:Glutamate/tyrosine decarboxylase-like PLP-dependent enzyme n=1 Tax=Lacibacter cauensis TaxID=510947 RepID=A0A562SFY1_9BACT|nr:pyridoxal-dependent decarboxylase [Lacibacter cauensis]TWI80123.1 glutamate/tyrosine decarboxylase-like PLP-dependent enzyme [Lacibacter cauensis]
MHQQLADDLANIESLLEVVKLQGLDYLGQLSQRPTIAATVEQTHNLSDEGIGTLRALELFNSQFEPVIISSSGPRYLGFVTGGSTPAAIAGDWLASIYDQNTQATNGQGDNSAIIEKATINLLLELFGLPKTFLGGFVTGATMSNFTCLATARQWAGKCQGRNISQSGISQNLHVLSANAHSSILKSMSMLGIGSANILKVGTEEGNRESIDLMDLENKVKLLKEQPFILVSSAGTVNTVDFDNFKAIAALKSKYSFWWHIDAAFGAFATCSPYYRHLLDGWENADSITIDCHKWLNVPYENAVFFIKTYHQDLQVETFQNSNAPYLGSLTDQFSYLNFLPENSRRLKALPVWFSLMAYGKKGFRAIVENSVDMARRLGEFIFLSEQFALLAPVRLNNVCFTLKNDKNQELVSVFLEQLNGTGKVFMTPTFYNGKKGIRASFVNWRTSVHDLEIITTTMISIARSINN